jgi:hypothetical protein
VPLCGKQEGRFFHYYAHDCYLLLISSAAITCCAHSNIDASADSPEEMQRVGLRSGALAQDADHPAR